jgi:hypothetical protein
MRRGDDEAMQQLTARLEALDPDIGKALKALSYFDRLIEGRVGAEGFVRGAAVLSGYTAGLSDPDRSIYIRVDPGGRRLDTRPTFDSRWPSYTLDPDWSATVWLENTEPLGSVEEMVIERFALGARLVLERTRGRLVRNDEATIEVLLDDAAPAELRLQKARSLGFAEHDRLRAYAVLDTTDLGSAARSLPVVKPHVGRFKSDHFSANARVGIGPETPILGLPASYRRAVAALRFTTAGERGRPGTRQLAADDLGALTALAEVGELRRIAIGDVQNLEEAIEKNPDLLITLEAFITHGSARAAAHALHVHHSTMQARMQQAEKLLGWPLSAPTNRFRLQLTMALRLLQRNEF